MGALDLVYLGLTHPSELRSMVSYKVWRDPLNDIKADPEASGWSRESMRDCWKFLDLTSRSFAAVIKELKGELSRVICLFYLILRGLDTIEDDMTIPHEKKIPLLRDFFKKLEEPGWNFQESGPNEKDRQLLVEFDKVIAEFQRLGPGYRTVISDITAKMGAGMASYIEASKSKPLAVEKWADYDLYCHFVAGLVGEGLSRLFSESGIERDWLGPQLSLSNHMGLFLQKTNIIRDYAEDCEEGRFFWPKECYAQKGADFASQADVAQGIVEVAPGARRFRPEGEAGRRAMFVLSSMLLDAVRHATQAIDYLSLLREQSVFNFCAIPQVMAIATIDLMFANPNVFRRNVKIRKGQAVQLILRAINPRDVSYIFLEYVRSIRGKLDPADPNFVQWSIELGRIETHVETLYPSFVAVGSGEGPAGTDMRAAELQRYSQQRMLLVKERAPALVARAEGEDPRMAGLTQGEREALKKKDAEEMYRVFFYIVMAMSILIAIVGLVGWMVAWYFTMDEPDPLSQFVVRNVKSLHFRLSNRLGHLGGITQEGAKALKEKLDL